MSKRYPGLGRKDIPVTKKKKDFRLTGAPRVVIFHRGDMWYPLELPMNDDLAAHAECNPGTTKITDGLTGQILWRPQ